MSERPGDEEGDDYPAEHPSEGALHAYPRHVERHPYLTRGYHEPRGLEPDHHRSPYEIRDVHFPEHNHPYRHEEHHGRYVDPHAGERATEEPPLRMIHVGPSMSRGGAEVWLLDLVRFLDPRRVRVVRAVVTSATYVDPRVVDDLNGIPVEVGGAEAVRRAACECDVLVCWGTPEFGTWLAPCRPPLCVFIAHGEGSWTLTALKGCAPVLDHVVAVSQGVHQRIENGVPSSVIFNGVDSSRLACSRSREETRRMLGFGPGDFVLGVVGRFSQEKRVHVVIDAIAALPESYKALLVGWGPLRGSLMDLANERIPGRYAFVQASHYLGDYYRAMDAACLLSREEGFALVTLEAMMCGRPLIVTPVGAVPEMIVDRVNGLIVSGTPESVAEAAQRLRQYPAWARGMAEEARGFAEEHGHARLMARRYEDLFHRLWREKKVRA